VVLVAVGADYKTWQGGLDAATGVARVGISYDKLCRSVKPGNVIKVGRWRLRPGPLPLGPVPFCPPACLRACLWVPMPNQPCAARALDPRSPTAP
jgi:hypothetical protein